MNGTKRRGLDKSSKNINPKIRENFTNALMNSQFKNLKEWAAASDVSYMSFHNYSSGKSYPTVKKAYRIARSAGIEITDLYPKEVLDV